jgi:hypothetical protein
MAPTSTIIRLITVAKTGRLMHISGSCICPGLCLCLCLCLYPISVFPALFLFAGKTETALAQVTGTGLISAPVLKCLAFSGKRKNAGKGEIG